MCISRFAVFDYPRRKIFHEDRTKLNQVVDNYVFCPPERHATTLIVISVPENPGSEIFTKIRHL